MEFEFWYALDKDQTKELILGSWLNTYETIFIDLDNEDVLKFNIKLNTLDNLIEVMCDLGENIVMFGDCIFPKLSTVRTMRELGLV